MNCPQCQKPMVKLVNAFTFACDRPRMHWSWRCGCGCTGTGGELIGASEGEMPSLVPAEPPLEVLPFLEPGTNRVRYRMTCGGKEAVYLQRFCSCGHSGLMHEDVTGCLQCGKAYESAPVASESPGKPRTWRDEPPML